MTSMKCVIAIVYKTQASVVQMINFNSSGISYVYIFLSLCNKSIIRRHKEQMTCTLTVVQMTNNSAKQQELKVQLKVFPFLSTQKMKLNLNNFSSPKPRVQVSFYYHMLSVVCLSENLQYFDFSKTTWSYITKRSVKYHYKKRI